MNNKLLTKTFIVNVAAFLVNSLIGLFTTPFLVNNVGAEAYGFITLANNFTSYAQIIMVALNSMAGRYITIAIHRGDNESANRYFNSVLAANLVMTLVLLVPSGLCIFFFDSLVNISEKLVLDVKLLFFAVFLSFYVTILGTAFSCSTFAANRRDLEASRMLESYLIKAFVIVLLFALFSPHVYFWGIAMLCMSLYTFITNVNYTKKLTPMLKLNKNACCKKSLFALLKSGVWNSVEKLSLTLSQGLSPLLANLYIGPDAMGVFSIARLLPGMIEMLIWYVAGIFTPEYTIAYAKKDKSKLMKSVGKSIIISGILCNICMCMVCVIAKEFYVLWVPDEDSSLLYVLTVLVFSGMYVSSALFYLANLLTVVNKIRIPALAKVGIGVLNFVLMIIVLKITNWGIYSIAAITSVTTVILQVAFYIPYTAHCIKEKMSIFYKSLIKIVVALAFSVAAGLFLKTFFTINGWFSLIFVGALVAICALVINVIVCTTLNDKKQAVRYIRLKLSKAEDAD